MNSYIWHVKWTNFFLNQSLLLKIAVALQYFTPKIYCKLHYCDKYCVYPLYISVVDNFTGKTYNLATVIRNTIYTTKGILCFVKSKYFVFVHKLMRLHNFDFSIFFHFLFNELFPNSKHDNAIQLSLLEYFVISYFRYWSKNFKVFRWMFFIPQKH